jgi:hypothetical protein
VPVLAGAMLLSGTNAAQAASATATASQAAIKAKAIRIGEANGRVVGVPVVTVTAVPEASAAQIQEVATELKGGRQVNVSVPGGNAMRLRLDGEHLPPRPVSPAAKLDHLQIHNCWHAGEPTPSQPPSLAQGPYLSEH